MTEAKGRPQQILTVTSMKGGVGKSTISAMLARFAAEVAPHPVLVLDLDPQAGISSLLLGGKIEGPTIADILDSEARGISSAGLFHEAVRPSRYSDQILVLPSGAALAHFATSSNSSAPNLLARALQTAPIPANTLVIIDTGTSPRLVGMGIAAAMTIIIPIMFSQQTARPTINTLMLASGAAGSRGALAPVGMGNTKWENRELGRWRKQLLGDEALVTMGFSVLPPFPYSRAIVRGRWRYGAFPQRFEPFFEALYSLAVHEDQARSSQCSGKQAAGHFLPERQAPTGGAEIPVWEDKTHPAKEGLLHGT